MKSESVWYLIAAVIFSLLAAGYVAVIVAVDLYDGYTPAYLIVLHIALVIVSSLAAIVNLRRYRKRRNGENPRP